MFSLTRREQIVLTLILTALLVGAGIRHLRQERLLAQSLPPFPAEQAPAPHGAVR